MEKDGNGSKGNYPDKGLNEPKAEFKRVSFAMVEENFKPMSK